jgi:hypothetical protein
MFDQGNAGDEESLFNYAMNLFRQIYKRITLIGKTGKEFSKPRYLIKGVLDIAINMAIIIRITEIGER